jgi:uncharacterized protein
MKGIMKQVLNYPRTIIISVLVITIFFLFQLPAIRVNNDLELFLGENNPAKTAYDAMQEVYKSTDAMVLALHNPYGKILTPETLILIDDLTRHLDTIPLIRSVMSLTNADYITGTQEGLIVEPLYPDAEWTEKSEEILKSRLLSWPDMYRLMLYSEDFKSTQIFLYMESHLHVEKLENAYNKTMDILNDRDTENLEIYIAGAPAISVILKEKMYSDMFRLIPIVVLVIIIVLYLSFRTTAGVILPLLTVGISSVWTLGLMSLLNFHLTMVGTAIPVILVSVGSAYCIHFISHYYDELRRRPKPLESQDEHKRVINTILSRIGTPIALAGFTTMVGFGSHITSSIVPMRESGLFLAFGVLTALVLTLIFIPSILLVRHRQLKQREGKTKNKMSLIDRFLLHFYDFFVRHSTRNLILTLMIIALSITGISRILVDTNMIETFRSNTTIARADRFQNETFGGTTILSVIVDGKENGALLDPDVLLAIDKMGRYLEEEIPLVGKVTSFTDLIKRMNQIMNMPDKTPRDDPFGNTDSFEEESGFSFGDYENINRSEDESFEEESGFSFEDYEAVEKEPEKTYSHQQEFPVPTEENVMKLLQTIRSNHSSGSLSGDELIDELFRLTNYGGAAYYEIPSDPEKYPAARGELRNLIAQYLLLYSGSVDEFVDDVLEPSQTRVMVQIRSPRNADTQAVEKHIHNYIRDTFPEGYDVTVTGIGTLTTSVNDLVMRSQTSSIITSLLIVFSIVALSYRSWLAGLFGIITLSLSLLINFGVMGFFHIKLDMGSSMVAAVAIGIGIDYTIHFLSAYRKARLESDDLELVSKQTLMTAGKAILFNAVSVGAGFAVLIHSNFIPLENLGLLIALTMLTSSLGALTVLPALLNTFKPEFIHKTRRKK